MKYRTTTRQLTEALADGFLTIIKAERYYKLSAQIKELNTEEFTEYIQFLNESGIFADFIGWYFEKADKEYVVESGRMNPDAECIIIVFLCVNDCVSVEDIERTLLFWEE